MNKKSPTSEGGRGNPQVLPRVGKQRSQRLSVRNRGFLKSESEGERPDNKLPTMAFEKEIKKLNKKLKGLENPELVEKQHQKGKLTARERINLLLDMGTSVELDPLTETRVDNFGLDKKKFPGDAVITGFGKINNRQVYLYSLL